MSKRQYTAYWQQMTIRKKQKQARRNKKEAMLRWFRMTPRERAWQRVYRAAYRKMHENMSDMFRTRFLFDRPSLLAKVQGKPIEWRKWSAPTE